jgi:predicted anti-sigma-YlaC factor YlaD
MAERGAPLIPCREAVRQLWDFLDGGISPVDHHQVAEHLAFCRRCCGELEFVAHLRDLLASQSADELEPQTIQRLERFVERL